VRAFIGEARSLPESMRRALEEFMLTRKACLVVALQEAQKRGLVREGADLSAAADFIRDSIHIRMLRHTLNRTDPETVYRGPRFLLETTGNHAIDCGSVYRHTR